MWRYWRSLGSKEMIDINRERLLTVAQVRKRLPGRSGPLGYETIRQWSKTGRRGVVLETVKVGGMRYTSEEALERFVAALAAIAGGIATAPKRRNNTPEEKAKNASAVLAARFGV